MAEASPPQPPSDTPAAQDPPEPAEQLAMIDGCDLFGVEQGSTWHMVPFHWWAAWRRFAKAAGGEGPPGPAHGEALLAEGAALGDAGEPRLRKGLVNGQDYKLLGPEAWALLREWHGGEAVPRPAYSEALGFPCKVEIYPYELSVRRLSADEGEDEGQLLRVSRVTTVGEVKAAACAALGVEGEARLWTVFNGRKDEALLREAETLLRARVDFDADLLLEEPPFSSTTTAAGQNDSDDGDDGYYGYGGYSSLSGLGGLGGSYSMPRPQHTRTGVRGTPSATAEPGLCGLSNLGNTCFMNSALQCLSNTTHLRHFFASDAYRAEINADNPLGTKGELATEFGELMAAVWRGAFSSVSPRDFKWALGQHAEQFSGFEQHDSQELIAYLLDGLHEDLNRVTDKPYVENKEAEGAPDAQAAAEAWERHQLRNDSVVVDLFQGQYKSRVTCPAEGCDRVSVTFDPFMYLSVPLPFEGQRSLSVTVIPAAPDAQPIALSLVMPRDTALSAAREMVGEKVGIAAESLFACEVFQSYVYQYYHDNKVVDDVPQHQDVYMFELAAPPTDIPPPAWLTTARALTADQAWLDAALAAPHYSTQRHNAVARFTDLHGDVLDAEQGQPGRCCDALPIHCAAGDHSDAAAERVAAAAARLKAVRAGDLADPLTVVTVLHTYEASYTSGAGVSYTRQHLFALPHLLRFTPERTTVGELREAIAARARHFCAAADAAALELRCVRSTGADCGRCAWSARCSGCVLADDELVSDACPTDDYAIACAWDAEAVDKEAANRAPVRLGQGSAEEGEEPEEKTLSITDCLELWCAEEQLAETEMWYCSQCQEHRQAMKKLDLWSAPQFLVVHIKRFQYNDIWRDKLDTLVDFPLDGLDLSPFVLDKRPETPAPVYDLVAVSNHFGMMGGGHYTAYVRNAADGEWYNMDDAYVERVEDPSKIVSEAAYVLFYKRRDVAGVPSSYPVSGSGGASGGDSDGSEEEKED